ncbi:NmrA-like family protein [Cylindrospermum stagnale PCC 7417]|uniref:NmrA-like family protein n=1 Tax=Cylindrospermum stagnale PCC 7417 TaxID=56107 RepID=K9WZS6_9NOST|nr:SDR family oxidoreductase [Cylindrospermum stagnale]AFZ25708.1 NmrA-like family protein [Cylindrospermum stagnale PCC 7417]
MTNPSNIFIGGASRGVGREIAKYLTAQNFKIKALLRTADTAAELEAIGIQTVLGNALNMSDVERAILANDRIYAVISTIGGLPQDGEKADFLGNKNLIDAAVKAGVQKFILVTSIGTGNSVVAMPPQALEALRPVLIEKEKAEQHLIASGLTYTIIRPGGLKSEPATGNGILTEDPRIIGSINRADVAQLVVRSLISDSVNNKILSAVDRNMVYPGQPEFVELSLDQ